MQNKEKGQNKYFEFHTEISLKSLNWTLWRETHSPQMMLGIGILPEKSWSNLRNAVRSRVTCTFVLNR